MLSPHEICGSNLIGSSLTEADQRAMAMANQDLRQPRPKYREIAQDILDKQTPTSPAKQEEPQHTGSREKGEMPGQHPGTGIRARNLTNDSGMTVTNAFIGAYAVPAEMELPLKQCQSNSSSWHNGSSTDVTIQQDGTQEFEDEDDSKSGKEGTNAVSGKSIGDYHEAGICPVRVYTLQGKRGEWREERLAHAEILQRLEALDRDKMTALDKKLTLSMEYQGRVDAIQTTVNDDESSPEDYRWNLRQLELKRREGRLARLRASQGLLAVIVYLKREAHQRRQRMQHSEHPGVRPGAAELSQLKRAAEASEASTQRPVDVPRILRAPLATPSSGSCLPPAKRPRLEDPTSQTQDTGVPKFPGMYLGPQQYFSSEIPTNHPIQPGSIDFKSYSFDGSTTGNSDFHWDSNNNNANEQIDAHVSDPPSPISWPAAGPEARPSSAQVPGESSSAAGGANMLSAVDFLLPSSRDDSGGTESNLRSDGPEQTASSHEAVIEFPRWISPGEAYYHYQPQNIEIDNDSPPTMGEDRVEVPPHVMPSHDAPLADSMLDDDTINQLMALLTPASLERPEVVTGQQSPSHVSS